MVGEETGSRQEVTAWLYDFLQGNQPEAEKVKTIQETFPTMDVGTFRKLAKVGMKLAAYDQGVQTAVQKEVKHSIAFGKEIRFVFGPGNASEPVEEAVALTVPATAPKPSSMVSS